MKLTKQLKEEVLKTYQASWNALVRGDIKTFASLLDDQVVIYGSAAGEIFTTKKAAVKFYTATADQITGKVDLRKRKIGLKAVNNTVVVHELCDFFFLNGEGWVYYGPARITDILEKKGKAWKIIHHHTSFPDGRTIEGEQFATEKIKAENLLLRDAVQRRTVELEHKNRELEIETALEKVRSVAMGMKKAEDMLSICQTISTELQKLGVKAIRNVQTAIIYKEKGTYTNYEFYTKHNKHLTTEVSYINHAMSKAFVKKMLEGPNKFFKRSLKGKKVQEWYAFQKKLTNQFADKYLAKASSLNYYWYSLGPVALGISSYAALNKEEEELVVRFKNVFELAYRRYLDIEKATAQAREAQIQLALERVRARTMAMQKSDELPEAAALLFQQVQSLGMPAWSAGYCTWNDDEKKSVTLWMSSEGVLQPPFIAPTTKDELFIQMRKGAEEGKTLHVVEMGGKPLVKHYQYMRTLPVVGEILDSIIAAGHPLPTFQIMHQAYFSKGFLLFITYEPVPEVYDIFKRFAKVFEQTYTRFLDLQKAEAQAREAQIEAALERVRSKTMAMHNSNDVGETAAVMVDELKKLGAETLRCGIGIMHEPGDMEVWTISTDENNKTDIIIGWLDMHMHPLLHGGFESWRAQVESFSYNLEGEDLFNYYNAINNYPGYPIRYNTSDLPSLIHHNEFHFAEGTLFSFSLQQLTNEQRKIFKRFALVFGQTYRRYLDLKKAEAQAREAQIEASLEKVRSRSLAMQKPGELLEVAELLRKEMGQLGVEELETSSIYIVDKDKERAECWYAIKDIREEHTKLVSDEIMITFNTTWVGNEMWKFYKSKKADTSIVMKGENRREWINYCASVSNVLQGYYGNEIPDRTYHLVKFSGGYMGAASPGDISAESWDLLRRAASVFSLAYTRFNDLQIAAANARQAEQDLIAIKEAKQKAEEALMELQATQKQLIQSEKMASLGELTAGIAHEIQNPLNFVNNFSEVSTELIKEMVEEVDKGNTDEVKMIADDLIGNLEKINHHGKRAADIVKGMLQHSRSGSSAKEPTDINALADEYLRLAYHGLRAKDKTFNAAMKTDYDPTIGNINIIPQDIGRVILNLITNAFYVVNEKAKQNIVGFEPKVEITTKKDGNKVLIAVKDNGNGISQKVLDKIFQPFFTTKPTGQGTGLGLSLSYDIVKAHGGELNVETKENEGTTFIILLPAS